MSADNYLKVDYDGEIFLIYEGFESNRLAASSGGYEPGLYDTAGSATVAEEIIEEYGYVEYGVEWTTSAREAAGMTASTSDKAVEAAVEQLSELNIKVVNLANKLEEHLKEIDAHHHVAVSGRVKKK